VGARHDVQNSAVWTSDSIVVLLDGIEANEQGKRLAEARLRALHPFSEGKDHYPTDFEKRLRKIFENRSADHIWPWLSLEFWQQEIDNVLVQGIFGRNGSKSSVVDRIHAVWPKLSATWLSDRMEEVARAGLPRWVQNDFWVMEVDPTLLVGIDRANGFRSNAVGRVLKRYSTLQIGTVWARVRALRNRRAAPAVVSCAGIQGWPDVFEGGSTPEETTCCCSHHGDVWQVVDPTLLEGIRKANQCEREAVDRVLGRFPELRIGAIWARLRQLRYRRKMTVPIEWTSELDERLIQVHREVGLSAAVSGIQSLTDWPRRAILRRAHKLGLHSQLAGGRRRWTMAEFRFAIESVNHLSVREIANELGRSESAVWHMLGDRGIPARFQDGHSVRELSSKLHVRRLSIQTWIKAGLLHKKRNGRISEDSLQSFLFTHAERINWPLLDEDTTFWVSELLEAERIRVSGSGARTRANSRNSERPQVAEASTPHGTASNASEPGPSEDPWSHRSRARGASPPQ
jgi:hypothetical protein